MKGEFEVIIVTLIMFLLIGCSQSSRLVSPIDLEPLPFSNEAVCETKSYWKKFIPNNK